jgi:hypothetical protein
MELAPRTREAEGGIAAAYAEGLHYGRLASLKKKYDAANLFHVNQNIRRAADSRELPGVTVKACKPQLGAVGCARQQAHIRSSTSNSRPQNPRKRGLRRRVTLSWATKN